MYVTLIIVGLIICFGGIYFKRVCAGILGFIWGALCALAFAIVVVGLWELDEDDTIMYMLVGGMILSVISAIYYRVCAAINGFTSSFSIILLLLLFSDDMESFEAAIFIALMAALFFGFITFKYYDISFILLTAYSGAFIASLGAFGLFEEMDMEDIFSSIMWSGFGEMTPILVGTLILGTVGVFVQLRRFGVINSKDTGSQESEGETSNRPHFIDKIRASAPRNSSGASAWTLIEKEKQSNIQEQLKKDKWILLCPFINYIAFPLFNRYLYYRLLYSGVSYQILDFINWLSLIFGGLTVGVLVFFVLTRSNKYNIVFVSACAACFLLMNITNIRYYYGWYLFIDLFQMPIYWAGLILVEKLIKKNTIKPLILILTGVFLDEYLYNFLRYFSFYFYFNRYTFYTLAAIALPVIFLFHKNYGINVFSFADTGGGIQSAGQTQPSVRPTPVVKAEQAPANGSETSQDTESFQYCPNCGKPLDGDEKYCWYCGCKFK